MYTRRKTMKREMMKQSTTSLCNAFTLMLLVAGSLLFAQTSFAAPSVGQPAPDFSLPDSYGKTHELADYLGKTVILEWTNHDCPYVRKHYESNNMQTLQKEMTDNGVVWLSVISSRPGSQGYVEAAEANELTASRSAHPTAVLFDPAGDTGRAYDARTTPHMYIIDPQGELIYMGAIDDQPSARASSLEGANNYVRAAMEDLKAGRKVETAQSTPYGCSVKY